MKNVKPPFHELTRWIMRTNKAERKKLRPLLKGLDHLNVGIIENKSSDLNFGIEIIKKWLKNNPEFFTEFYNEVK